MVGFLIPPTPVIRWVEGFVLVVDSKALEAHPNPIPSQKQVLGAESRA